MGGDGDIINGHIGGNDVYLEYMIIGGPDDDTGW